MKYKQILRCPVFVNDGWVTVIDGIGRLGVMDSQERGTFFRGEGKVKELCGGEGELEPIVEHRLFPELIRTVQKVSQNTTTSASSSSASASASVSGPSSSSSSKMDPQQASQAALEKQELLSALPLVFLLLPRLGGDKFKETIMPLVPSLFSVVDRAVRATLLQSLPTLIPTITTRLGSGPAGKFINQKIFDPLCGGFTDSEPQLREITLKSCLPLIQSLTASNLEKLSRYLVRLQGDPVPGIRTNTVIFIGKITPLLTENGREKVTLSSFERGCGDPFVPCRVASVKALVACGGFFGDDVVGGRWREREQGGRGHFCVIIFETRNNNKIRK